MVKMTQSFEYWLFKYHRDIFALVWDFKPDDIGVRYFLTKEEAEAKLKELKNNAR